MNHEMILFSAADLKALLESVPDGVIVKITVERKEDGDGKAEEEPRPVQHQ